MTYTRPILEAIELDVNELGMKYIKIIRRPSDDKPILDIMFLNGLRLTVDMTYNMSVHDIGRQLHINLKEVRPHSFIEYESAIVAIIYSIERVFSYPNGKIIQIDFNKKEKIELELHKRWSESLFFVWMKKSEFMKRYPYELILRTITELYIE